MSDVIQFPIENLRKEIREGNISGNLKKLIRTELADLSVYKPNSWDRRFCEHMLTYSKRLSAKQAEHLERILDGILARTEHPSLTPKFLLPDPEGGK